MVKTLGRATMSGHPVMLPRRLIRRSGDYWIIRFRG